MSKWISVLAAFFFAMAPAVALGQQPSATDSFVFSNNDSPAFINSVTIYTIGSDGRPVRSAVVPTDGMGIGGGFFAASRLLVIPTGSTICLFASDAGTGDIAGIDANTQTVTGNFAGSSSDIGLANGIGMAASSSHIYASYSTSSTIGTFSIASGCTLNFVGDVTAVGLRNGIVTGMAAHGNLLVVSYGDGSIGTFNITGGTPVSNNDTRFSAGSKEEHFPNGIDITADGHFAIFGDASTVGTVEIADISSGKLTNTIPYNVTTGWNSGSVRLSPDESVIFVTNSSSGQVTAAFFDKTTGKVSTGCTSSTLKKFYTQWAYAGRVALQSTTGTGGLLYVPEFGANGFSSIGLLEFTSTGKTCSLTELTSSPVSNEMDPAALMSIEVYPPRPF
jgi:6-phosphogluconolactonase (cycloisomerase 2 family)